MKRSLLSHVEGWRSVHHPLEARVRTELAAIWADARYPADLLFLRRQVFTRRLVALGEPAAPALAA